MVERKIELKRRYHRKKKLSKLKAKLAASKEGRERGKPLAEDSYSQSLVDRTPGRQVIKVVERRLRRAGGVSPWLLDVNGFFEVTGGLTPPARRGVTQRGE